MTRSLAYAKMVRRKNYFLVQAEPMAKTETGKRKVKWIRYALLALVLVGLHHILSGPSGVLNLLRLRESNLHDSRDLDSLQRLKQELAQEKLRLAKDSAYLERMARKELGMSRPGEKVFRFMDPRSQPPRGRLDPKK